MKKSVGHLHVTAGWQQLEYAQPGSGQRLDDPLARLGGVPLRGADLQRRTDELLGERIGARLCRMLYQIAGHLRSGGDDRVEEVAVAGCLKGVGQDAGSRRVLASDRGGGQ